jgi:hypothetical protein
VFFSLNFTLRYSSSNNDPVRKAGGFPLFAFGRFFSLEIMGEEKHALDETCGSKYDLCCEITTGTLNESARNPVLQNSSFCQPPITAYDVC